MKTTTNQAGSMVSTLLLAAAVALLGIAVSMTPTLAFAEGCSEQHTSSIATTHSPCCVATATTDAYVIGKGSYYHKIATEFGAYTGIVGEITLPAPQLDPRRISKSGKPLDGFSIYMGGNADGQEVDAGFSWEKNPAKSTNSPQMVWRPFARAKRWLDSDTQMTWNPGETVRLSVTIVKDGVLRLSVEDVGVEHPRRYSRDFEAWHFRHGTSCQFKRVNAIDQAGREGKNTLPTNSKVLGAIWKSTYVLTGMGAKQEMHSLGSIAHVQHDESCANVCVNSTDSQSSVGGEAVDVYGDSRELAKGISAKKQGDSCPPSPSAHNRAEDAH
ncbi:MAG TPA: hypothetical protein V6C97_18940 [Oculatellaceae cyanobacterium]